MKFKSAVLIDKKKVKIMESVISPKIGKNKILVKVLYSGICRSQIMEIDFKRGKDKFLPHMLGHEAVGIVISHGEKIKKVRKNQKVVLSWIKGNGISSGGGLINLNGREVNYGPVSTLSNYAIVSEDRCFPVQNNFPIDVGSFFGCSVLTGAGMVYNKFRIKKKDRVLVIGAGGIGLSTLLALKSLNIQNVCVIENNFSKYKLIKEIGYKDIFKSTDKKLSKYISNLTGKNLFDYCFESAGQIQSIEMGIKLLNDKGSILFASHPEKNKKLSIDPHDLIKGKKVFGSWGGGCLPDKDIKKIYKIFKKKNLIKYLKSKVYNLHQINLAIDEFRKGKIIRPLIKMTH